MNKNLQRLAEPGGRLYLIFLVLFAAAALFFKMYELAVAEGVIILILMIYPSSPAAAAQSSWNRTSSP